MQTTRTIKHKGTRITLERVAPKTWTARIEATGELLCEGAPSQMLAAVAAHTEMAMRFAAARKASRRNR